MTIYPINILIPNAPDDPADDQPIMQQNTANTFAYLKVDHVTPGSQKNGFHSQSSYVARTQPANLTNANSGFASNGIAYANSANNNDYHYYNGSGVNQGNFPLNLTKAYCYVTIDPVTFTISLANKFNIGSVTRSSVGHYTVNFNIPSNTLSYGVLTSFVTSPNIPVAPGPVFLCSYATTYTMTSFNLEFASGKTIINYSNGTYFDPLGFTAAVLLF